MKPSCTQRAKSLRIQACLMQLEYVLGSLSCGAVRQAVAAVVCLSSTVSLDGVIPVLTKDSQLSR